MQEKQLDEQNTQRFARCTIDDSGCIMSRDEALLSISQRRARGELDIVRREERKERSLTNTSGTQ